MSDSSIRLSTPRVAAIGATILGIGTAGFYYLPGMLSENAKGDRWVNSFYCATATLTT